MYLCVIVCGGNCCQHHLWLFLAVVNIISWLLSTSTSSFRACLSLFLSVPVRVCCQHQHHLLESVWVYSCLYPSCCWCCCWWLLLITAVAVVFLSWQQLLDFFVVFTHRCIYACCCVGNKVVIWMWQVHFSFLVFFLKNSFLIIPCDKFSCFYFFITIAWDNFSIVIITYDELIYLIFYYYH